MTIYRLTKAKYRETAFTGTGSLLSGGRWHEVGIPVVYASDTPASALLEIIAHTEAASLLSHAYVFTIDLDRARHLLVLVGRRWFENQDSVILEVPSAIVPQQRNYLINPQHPCFEELTISGPVPFEIDPRLT